MENTLNQKVEEILLSKGIKINIVGCRCCSSPVVSLEVDGELIIDREGDFIIEMIPV